MKHKNNHISRHAPIAVIGMGCLFPGASGLKGYLRLLFNGEDAITIVPETHWSCNDFFDADPKKPDHVYCNSGGFISPLSFDPTEFGIPPSSLEATDTSQLLGLVVAKNAIEDAFGKTDIGFDRSRTSVILGVTGTQELVIPLGARLGHPIWRKALESAGIDPHKTSQVIQEISDAYVPWQENSFPGLLGNVVAGRIANRLDLGGTNCVVDAACASSMSAIHLGVLELLSGRSDTIITGGVDMLNDIFMHMCFSKTMVLSPTGNARPFSKDADGTVLGEGIGLFILQRLEDAQKDGRRIYAVIKGVGSSSDGKSQSIYAPRAQGQAKALQTAYENAGIDPDTVELIEAHGTGTRVGDEVEFQALNGLFGKSGNQRQWCALGSVKSMIGHTKAAAGAAGLMKAILAVHHKVLPPTLKVHEPDPKLNIRQSPFYLSTQTRPWFSKKEHPRRAGVSAFGFGGSNFHVVIEEFQKEKSTVSWDGSVEIVAFSASDQKRLKQNIEQFKKVAVNLSSYEDICPETDKTRSEFSAKDPYRLLLVLDTSTDFADVLDQAIRIVATANQEVVRQRENMFYGGPEPTGKLSFIFPGQGSQYIDMGRDLVCSFPEALSVFEQANTLFEDDGPLTDYIYPIPAQNKAEQSQQHETLKRTDIAQPAIGAVSMAMLNVLRHFGLQPDAVCGHSFGELSALCAAGRIDIQTFLLLSMTRGRLMAQTGPSNGGMLAVQAPLNELETLIKAANLNVVLANRNSPVQGVLSGPVDALVLAEEKCKAHGFKTMRLPVSAAFHSKLVKEAQIPFSQAITSIDIKETDIPVFSNTTGKPYPPEIEKAKRLLADHLLSPVNFLDEIRQLYAMGIRTFVEVGPRSVLTGLVKSILKDLPFTAVSLDSTMGKPSGIADLAKTLCLLASLGHDINLTAWNPGIKDAKKQRMSILLSGTNYRNRESAAGDRRSEVRGQKSGAGILKSEVLGQNSEDKNPVLNTERTEQTTPEKQQKIQPEHREISSKNIIDIQNTMKTKHTKNNIVLDALQVLQDGLKSMQALQKQTAETHQKFLETQTQAAKTLQQMMENTQRMVEESLGFKTDRITLHERIEEQKGLSITPVRDEKNKMPGGSDDHLDATFSDTLSDKAVFEAPDSDRKTHDTIPADNDEKEIIHLLLSTVSRLTGYPVEMLALDMDIEADLGIDSIKRVEILSAVEEKMPELPTVSPDVMGTLKTLGQIVEYLAGSPANATSVSESQTISTSSTGRGEVNNILLETVSRLTGYPVEMLALDMDIEADLGIDSIKRVEILSAIEEKMPELPTVSPDVMGTLKTLEQIVEYLAGSPANATSVSESQTMSTSSTGRGEVNNILLETVSRLTGYPVEMLALDMDIEADLGIDSIKRVEILSAIEEKMPELPTVSPDVMGTLKTLGQIVEYLAGSPSSPVPASETSVADPDPHSVPIRESVLPSSPIICNASPEISVADIGRKAVKAVERPFARSMPLSLPHGRTVYVTDDKSGLSQAIVDEFKSQDIMAEILSDKQLSEAASGKISIKNPAGLIILAVQPMDGGYLKQAFSLAKSVGPHLLDSAEKGGAIFASVTRLDGAFGFKGKGIDHSLQGGLAGLVKTAAVEWENVRCRAFDIAPCRQDHGDIAGTLISELLYADSSGPVEVGIDKETRWIPELESLPFPKGKIRLDPKDVVIVTGGARGITAAAACALADHAKPTLVLLGRSSPPAAEPEWLKGIEDPAAVKKAIFDNELSGDCPAPVHLERIYKKVMAHREIAKNLETIKSFGADVHYYSVDVRDADAVNTILTDVRNTLGPIKGIIHGAGLLADSRIIDKSTAQFETVFSTKVDGLRTLLSATEKDPLNYLILFSSITARIGNNGQADYAMANEVLNKMAQKESVRRPDCRVISINWGPWDGGMVCSALKRKFENSGVDLIPVNAGAMCMIHEMKGDKSSPVEVVIGADVLFEKKASEVKNSELERPVALNRKEQLSMTVQREIDVDRYPILGAHILDGKPVVPFALIAEWLGHGALHDNPGLLLHGLDDMRIFQGIKLDQKKKHIRLMAGKARKKGAAFEVDVQIRDGIKDNIDVIHSGATAVLIDRLEPPPTFNLTAYIGTNGYSKTIDDIYESILFHGVELQGIREIMGYSSRFITARISSAPSPSVWMTEPMRSKWIADPLVLDSACQMAILWCFEERGMVSLPSYCASYRQYRDAFPLDGVIAVLEIKEATDHKIKGDFTFLDAHEVVVARMIGYEAVMDRSLSRAFKPGQAA